MHQCDRCGAWLGITAWTCAACQQLATYLWKTAPEVGEK